MGIVSNTDKRRIKFFRKQLNLDKYFSIFLSRDDTGKNKKPNPYPILWGLKLLKDKDNLGKINKANVYFFGDLPSDIECAQRARVKSIAVLTGHGKLEDLLKANPDFTINNYEELKDLPPFKKFLID